MRKKSLPGSVLNISEGIRPPSPVNDDAVRRLKYARSERIKKSDYVEGILRGDITSLSQAITLVESSLHKHQKTAQKIIEKCLPHSGKSIRIGITGVPGVGKSTFIEAFGSYLISLGRKIAVLAVDPSSTRSGGSILGDKTRMESLAVSPHAFIRPSPSGGSLGGVARKTRESVILCEAAGFDTIIIETVGVGQSETAVRSMVDFFLLLMLAGAGDELQGIKRGIMEMADLIAINKADGDNIDHARLAKAEYESALHLFPPSDSGWKAGVVTCSARSGLGISEIWQIIESFNKQYSLNGYLQLNRNYQSKYWIYETLNEEMKRTFYSNPAIIDYSRILEEEVLAGRKSSFVAADELLKLFLNKVQRKGNQ